MRNQGAFVSLLRLFETPVIPEKTASPNRSPTGPPQARPRPHTAARHSPPLRRSPALRRGAVSLRPEAPTTPASAVSPKAEAPPHKTPALAGVRQSQPRRGGEGEGEGGGRPVPHSPCAPLPRPTRSSAARSPAGPATSWRWRRPKHPRGRRQPSYRGRRGPTAARPLAAPSGSPLDNRPVPLPRGVV